MLPPVSAVSTADASFLISGSRPEDAPANQAKPPVSQVEQEIANLGAGATARSLSGGVQLSQNVNVLAETLGKLMNIARMDGETAENYVNRLVATMQSLPAGDRAALEKQLGTLLRGMSLSILADVLKNSAGPEAARIAIMLELARAGTTTRGGNPSVAQYLRDVVQQDGDTPLPQVSVARPSPSNLSAGEGAVITSAEDGPEFSQSTKQPAPQGRDVPATTTQPKQAATAALPNLVVSLPSGGGDAEDARPLPALMRPVQDAGEIPPKDAALRTGAAAAIRPVPLQSLPVTDEQLITLPMKQDEQAVPRSSQPPAMPQQDTPMAAMAPNGSPFAGATPKEMERLLLAVLLGKSPESADDTALSGTDRSLADLGKELSAKHPMPSTTATQAGSTGASNDEASLSTSRPEMAAAQKAAMAADAKTAILDQPALQSAVASLIGKEGTPLPFINYPVEKDEPESDAPPRGRWPSSEEGAEEDGNGGEGHQEQAAAEEEERVAANDENIDHSVSEGANDDTSIGNAEFYYLRMSGFS